MTENLFAGEDKTVVISFSSPVGGAGATLLAANSAIQLAKKGNSVLLLDAALTKASCHLALGAGLPEKNLSVLAASKGNDLKSCIVQTTISNLSLVAGSSDVSDVANVPYLIKQKIISELRELPFDYIVIDSGSGTGSDSLDLTLSADLAIFPIAPNLNSIEPFYRYIRALLHRLLLVSLNKKRYQALSPKISFLSPLPSLFKLEETGEGDLREIEKALCKRRFGFVFTKVDFEKEIRHGIEIESIIKDYFKLPVTFMGSLDWDIIAKNAFSAMEAISKNYPICAYSLSVEKLVNRITKDLKEPPPPIPRSVTLEENVTAYKILELAPNASPKEIQLAYSKKLEPYLDNSFISIGLLSKEEKEKKRDALEGSYKLLINTQSRQKYDEELIKQGVLSEEERISDYKEAQQENFQQAAEVAGRNGESKNGDEENYRQAAVTFYDGPSLKSARESYRISVEEIVAETNIRSWYIKSIEEERYDALPARMYVKGFLKQIAQYLHLTPEKVLRDYLEKYDAWAGSRAD